MTDDRDAPRAPVSVEAFIARARAGDAAAFDEIVRRYESLVLRIARRMTGNREDALDVSQESFLRIYRSLGRFGEGRRFESWVYRIVVNASMDLLKKRGGLRLVPLDLAPGGGPEPEAAPATGPERAVFLGEVRERLDALLGELPPRLRATFVLRDVEGLETAEIARILNCREVTVRRHSMEARERVRTLLNKRFPGLAPNR